MRVVSRVNHLFIGTRSLVRCKENSYQVIGRLIYLEEPSLDSLMKGNGFRENNIETIRQRNVEIR